MVYRACMHFVCFQDILIGAAKLTAPHTIKYNLPGRVDVGGEVTAKDIMLATGSVPFVPPGIPIDGKTVSCLMYGLHGITALHQVICCVCHYTAVDNLWHVHPDPTQDVVSSYMHWFFSMAVTLMSCFLCRCLPCKPLVKCCRSSRQTMP